MNFPRDMQIDEEKEKEKKINVTSCGGKATTIVYKYQVNTNTTVQKINIFRINKPTAKPLIAQ